MVRGVQCGDTALDRAKERVNEEIVALVEAHIASSSSTEERKSDAVSRPVAPAVELPDEYIPCGRGSKEFNMLWSYLTNWDEVKRSIEAEEVNPNVGADDIRVSERPFDHYHVLL